MAKAIISSILEAQLGKYVDGLRSDSLVVGLWSGELELRNLRLKPHALAELQLPVTVASGTVARVVVRVPWNQLGSASVAISLEGISALVVPNTERPSPIELLQAKQNQLERRELIRQHRRFTARVASGHSPKKQQEQKTTEDEGTFVSRLTARIVANLQVTLHDVHLRYEDVLANPETPFACGILLKRFRFYTTDEEGTEAFVGQIIGNNGFTYKKAELTHCGLYWDRLDQKNARLETQDKIPEILIEMLSEKERDQRRWVVRPFSVVVQLTKNESTNYSTVAKYTVDAHIGALQGHLTRDQYQDGVFLRRVFVSRQAVEAHFILARGRPFHPPHARPREWWDYATRLVVENIQRRASENPTRAKNRIVYCRKMRWSSIHQAVLEQRLYFDAFRTEIRHGSALDPSTREGKIKLRYEEIYPLDVILQLRDAAQDVEERQEAKAETTKGVSDQAGGGSWYSYFFGDPENEAQDEDNVLSAEGRNDLREAYDDALEKASSAHQVPMGCNLMSINVDFTKGTLALYQSNTHTSPFVTGMLQGSLTLNLQPENEWDTQLRVQKFNVINGLAQDTRFRLFCNPSTSTTDPTTSCVSIDYSRRTITNASHSQTDIDVEAIYKLHVCSQPIQMLIDPSFVLFLQAFFVSLLPERELEKVWNFATSSVADWIFADDTEAAEVKAEKKAQEAELLHSLERVQGRAIYDVIIDVEAPVVVLPEDTSDLAGAVVVVDLGKFRFCNDDKGTVVDPRADKSWAGDERLYWRLSMTQIHVLLGRQEQLIHWTNEEYRSLFKIVEDLSIELALDTRVSTSLVRLPSRGLNRTIKSRPHVGVHADIPNIVISMAEEQLVALCQIYSSIITQAAKVKHFVSIESQRSSENSDIRLSEPNYRTDENPRSIVCIPPVEEKFVFEIQFFLGCVELNLRESIEKEAFLIRASDSSCIFRKYTSHETFNARLKALVMEDRLHSSDSHYFHLISTGTCEKETPCLISIDIVTFFRESTEDYPVTQLEADVQFSVLHVQWNPSSMALLYRIFSTSTSALETNKRRDNPALLPSKQLMPDKGAVKILKESVADLCTLRARGHPAIVIRASLVQFSVTLNKDQLNRQLARLEMTNAAIEYKHYEANKGQDAFELTGYVGNFTGTDLSTSKHPLYLTLLGLDENEACYSMASENQVKALVSFEYVSDTVVSEKSSLHLSFLPIRGVYFHQQILELVDFVLEGVLGAIVSQTLINATQLLLRKDEAIVVFNLSMEKPTLIFPLNLQNAPHVKVTANNLRLVHFPSSVAHYERPSEVKHIYHSREILNTLNRKLEAHNDDVFLRVDCKELFLEQVQIYCTSPRTKSSKEGLAYEKLMPNPADLKISIEDLSSSTISLEDSGKTFLPRLSINSVLPPLAIHLSRTSYLGIVALLIENFGADALQNDSSIPLESKHSTKLRSRRPAVMYTYLQPDAEQTTFQVRFVMNKVQILLSQDATIDARSLPLSACDQMRHSDGFADVVATDFSLVFDNNYDANPSLAIDLGAFCARDFVGQYSEQCGILLESSEPLAIRYTWNYTALTGELKLYLSKVLGTVNPVPLLSAIDFFTLPSSLDRLEKHSISSTDHMLPSNAQEKPQSLLAQQRESISDILRDGKDPEVTMTVRIVAKRMGLALPRDAYNLESPRVVFTGDFTTEYIWRPQPEKSNEANDLNIQSSIIFDAKNMEMVLENAHRLGCCVASPSRNGQWNVIDVAPLIQIFEPSSLHLEINDLFPHADQRQQIVALSLTPIEVFVSYEDACMAIETFESMNQSIQHYRQRITCFVHESCAERPIDQSLARLLPLSKGETTKVRNQIEIHQYFTCELPSVSLTLVNDCDGCDMGLVQLQIERCHGFLNVTHTDGANTIREGSAGFSTMNQYATTALSGGGQLIVVISHFNPETRDWHPMCTEWALDASVQGSLASEKELHVILTASHALNLTITHELLEVAASVGGAWKRRAALLGDNAGSRDDEIERRKLAPCVIRNETGLPLIFWLTNGTFTTKPLVVSTGKLADVRYIHALGRGRGVVRRYASGDREAADLRLCLQLMDLKLKTPRFEAVESLVIEQLGIRTFPLVDMKRQRTNFKLSLSAQLIEGRILLVVSSPIKLVNRLTTGRAVALLVNDPTWQSPVEIGILRPNQESAVPVLLSLASEVRVRPAENEVAYSWSAPIPVQTRSVAELKVEAAVSSPARKHDGSENRTAVYCVAMSIESKGDMRTVAFAEPIVLVNKLPVPVTFRVQSAYSSAYGTSDSPSQLEMIAVGAKTSIWWTDLAKRPLFQLEVKGCTMPSKWLELAPQGTANGAVLSIQLLRVVDKRPFKLLVRVIGGTECMARPVRVEILADVWIINRSGLDLVYGTAADSEAYLPPRAARAQVGNAQICAYSSGNSDKVPMLRIGFRGCNWSTRFEADPRKLSWQDECISLRSAGGSATSRGVFYELGVSADYATRHFGSVTTLVSVFPRYLVVNRSLHTLLLLEAPSRQLEGIQDSRNENAADHILGSGDWYALYWIGGTRAPLRASIVPHENASESFCSDGYDWTAPFAVDRVAMTSLLVPPRSSGRGVNLDVAVKRGNFSQATFVVVVTDTSPKVMPSRLEQTRSICNDARVTTRDWQTISVHAQIASVIVTLTDKKQGNAGRFESESVARITLTRIGLEASWALQFTAVKVNLMGLQVEDLLPKSKNRIVFRPLDQESGLYADQSFLELTYLERPHAKYTWVERVHLQLQNAKISTSMSFIDRVNKLQKETWAHFQHKSLVSAFPSEEETELESDDEDLLTYFVPPKDEDQEGAVDLTAMTGRKVYIASGEISPVRVIVSFTRDKSNSSQREGFWLSNLKLQIDNACVTLEGYRVSHALATQESLGAAIVRFYEQVVKSQALHLIDSIQVTSLVTSMVTGGVTSLVSTLRGKADPAAAAGALAPGLLTSSVNENTSFGAPFKYERLSNNDIMQKHSQAFSACRSSALFLRQVRHLVYDWDANHTGLEARGCVVLALINNSRQSLVVNTQLNDGASLRVLPIGRRSLAGVLETTTERSTAAVNSTDTWRPDRALVVIAYGYTPTLLTSGDVYFTVHSNACNVYATRKTARLKANRGFTATFTLQETQSWWAANVVIIGDDLRANESRNRNSQTHCIGPSSDQDNGKRDEEYEIKFTQASLGLVAKQSGQLVIVRECIPSSAAEATGRIVAGDCIVAVNGVTVTNTSQFKSLVSKLPRPIVLRFRSTGLQHDAAFDLFGEFKEDGANLFGD